MKSGFRAPQQTKRNPRFPIFHDFGAFPGLLQASAKGAVEHDSIEKLLRQSCAKIISPSYRRQTRPNRARAASLSPKGRPSALPLLPTRRHFCEKVRFLRLKLLRENFRVDGKLGAAVSCRLRAGFAKVSEKSRSSAFCPVVGGHDFSKSLQVAGTFLRYFGTRRAPFRWLRDAKRLHFPRPRRSWSAASASRRNNFDARSGRIRRPISRISHARHVGWLRAEEAPGCSKNAQKREKRKIKKGRKKENQKGKKNQKGDDR